MYFGTTPFSAAAFSDVGFSPNAYVNVVGSRLNINIGNSTIIGRANVSVTGKRVNIGTSDVTIVAKAREILTGQRLNLAIGNAEASIAVSYTHLTLPTILRV